MAELVVDIRNLSKCYRLGVIGSGTLQGDLQSLWARLRGREDPNSPVGSTGQPGQRFQALDGVSLQIYKGDTIGIIGRNGAGKSTLLKILSRVTAPTEGEIRVKGRVASMLEVGTGFHRELTGRENIYLNGAIMGMDRAQVDARMEDIIAFSEIGQFIDTPVKRYSSGMYVKLAFSVAAHLDADILIMDEVLAVGDAVFRKKCTDKIMQLAREENKTVIFVSHDMGTVSQMCSRCAVLDQGRLIFDGSTEEAIALYYGRGEERALVTFDLQKQLRDPRCEGGARLLQLRYVNQPEPVFPAEEGIRAVLRWENAGTRQDLCFRLTLLDNGTPAGTWLTPCVPGPLEPGTYETEFALDTHSLTPGTYVLNLAIHRHTAEGLHGILDYVPEAASFRISRGRLENKGWNHRFWGSVLLEEPQLLQNRKYEV